MRFAYGLDLGKITDYTAHVVVDRQRVFKDQAVNRGHVQWRSALEVPLTRYDTRYIWRGRDIAYELHGQRVRNLMMSPEMWEETDLVVDATGVGVAVVERLRYLGLNPIPVMITGGQVPSFNQERGVYTVPKRDLAMVVGNVLESRRLRIIDSPEGIALRQELYGVRAVVSEATGHTRFEHREGEHDDMWLALALAVWWHEMDLDFGEEPDPEYQEKFVRRGGMEDRIGS